MADVPIGIFRKVFSLVGGIFIYLKKNFTPEPDEYISKKVIGGTISQVDDAPYSFQGLGAQGHYLDLNLDNYYFDVYFYQYSGDTLYSRFDSYYIERILVNGQDTLGAFPITGNYDGFTACYDSGDDENYGYWLKASTDNTDNEFTFTIAVDRFVFDDTIFDATAITPTSLTDVDFVTSENTSWDNILSADFGTFTDEIKFLTYGVPSNNGKKVAYTILRSQTYYDSLDLETKSLRYSYVFVLDIDTMTITLENQGAWFNPTVIDHEIEEKLACVVDVGCTLTTVSDGASDSTLTYPISAGFDDSNALSVVTVVAELTADGYSGTGFGDSVNHTSTYFDRGFSGSSTFTLKFGSTAYKTWSNDWSWTNNTTSGQSEATRIMTQDSTFNEVEFKILSIARKEISFASEETELDSTNTLDYTAGHTPLEWETDGIASNVTVTTYTFDHFFNTETVNIREQKHTRTLTDTTDTSYSDDAPSAFYQGSNSTNDYYYTIYGESGANWFYQADAFILNNLASQSKAIVATKFGWNAHTNRYSAMRSSSDDKSIIYYYIPKLTAVTPPTGYSDAIVNTNIDYTKDATSSYGVIYVNGTLQEDTNWTDGTWKWPAIQYSVRVALP